MNTLCQGCGQPLRYNAKVLCDFCGEVTAAQHQRSLRAHRKYDLIQCALRGGKFEAICVVENVEKILSEMYGDEKFLVDHMKDYG